MSRSRVVSTGRPSHDRRVFAYTGKAREQPITGTLLQTRGYGHGSRMHWTSPGGSLGGSVAGCSGPEDCVGSEVGSFVGSLLGSGVVGAVVGVCVTDAVGVTVT